MAGPAYSADQRVTRHQVPVECFHEEPFASPHTRPEALFSAMSGEPRHTNRVVVGPARVWRRWERTLPSFEKELTMTSDHDGFAGRPPCADAVRRRRVR